MDVGTLGQLKRSDAIFVLIVEAPVPIEVVTLISCHYLRKFSPKEWPAFTRPITYQRVASVITYRLIPYV